MGEGNGGAARSELTEARAPAPKAVLFDMGGVLLDAADRWDAAQFPVSFPNGLPEPAPLEWFLAMSSDIMETFVALPPPRPAMDVRPLIAAWLRKRSIEADSETVERWFDVLMRWEASPVYPFVPAPLRALASMGIRLGVISNTLMPAKYIRERFRDAGILDLFEFTVFSAEYGVNKPDPALFRHALDAMRLRPEEAWYVGDKPQRDVCGAHGAGMTAVLVDSRHHHRIHDGPDHVPDFRIPTIAALPDRIAKIA